MTNYHYKRNRGSKPQMKDGLTVSSAIVTMVTSMMGVGINCMPRAFKYVDAGYGSASGMLLIILVGLLTFFSLYAVSIAASKSKDPSPTYSSLASPISDKFKILVDMSVFGCCFGANLAFYMYLSDLALAMFPSIKLHVGSDEAAKKVVVSALAIPFFLLTLKKNLSSLKITSYITVISVTYLAVLMIVYSVFIGKECAEDIDGPLQSDISQAIPSFMLAMSCQANMVKVYTELQSKSNKNIIKVSLGAALFGTLIYGLVGMCGYNVFGRSIEKKIADILIDPKSNINVYLKENTIDKYALTSRIASLGTMLVLFGGFPVQLNPLSGMLMTYLAREGSNEDRKRIGLNFVLVVALLSLVLLDLNTDKVLGIVGATAVNLMSFLYPSIYYIYAKKRLDVMTVFAGLVGIMSIVTMFYMTYNVVKS